LEKKLQRYVIRVRRGKSTFRGILTKGRGSILIVFGTKSTTKKEKRTHRDTIQSYIKKSVKTIHVLKRGDEKNNKKGNYGAGTGGRKSNEERKDSFKKDL